jgi:hypothetical protein
VYDRGFLIRFPATAEFFAPSALYRCGQIPICEWRRQTSYCNSWPSLDRWPQWLTSNQSCQSKNYVTTDGQSVNLSWCQAPSWAQDQLRVCWSEAPSLTRGRVCSLRLLLALASAVILGSESYGTYDHILLSHIRDYLNLEGKVAYIYIPQEQSGPVIPPGTGFSLCYFLRLARLQWRYSNLPPHGLLYPKALTIYS